MQNKFYTWNTVLTHKMSIYFFFYYENHQNEHVENNLLKMGLEKKCTAAFFMYLT